MSIQTQEEVSNTKKEFAFTSSSIILQVSRGILVGIFVGAIVGSFRFLIEKGFHIIQYFYQQGLERISLFPFYSSAILRLRDLDKRKINKIRKGY